MNLRSLISTGMGQTLIITLILSLSLPAMLIILTKFIQHRRMFGIVVLTLYVSIVFYLTLLDREVGENGRINLIPFWTYQYFSSAQYRWQIFLNVILFMPLGFLLPWAFRIKFMRVILIGLFFSVLLELIQYLYKLGLCEVDDVIHNTLGSAIGYGYWKILDIIDQIHGDKFRTSLVRCWKCITKK